MFDNDKCKKITHEELLLIKPPFFSTFDKSFVSYQEGFTTLQHIKVEEN